MTNKEALQVQEKIHNKRFLFMPVSDEIKESTEIAIKAIKKQLNTATWEMTVFRFYDEKKNIYTNAEGIRCPNCFNAFKLSYWDHRWMHCPKCGVPITMEPLGYGD